MKHLYIKITLMFGKHSHGSYIEPVDKKISFTNNNGPTKLSGDWYKIEFIKMTGDEYKNSSYHKGF